MAKCGDRPTPTLRKRMLTSRSAEEVPIGELHGGGCTLEQYHSVTESTKLRDHVQTPPSPAWNVSVTSLSARMLRSCECRHPEERSAEAPLCVFCLTSKQSPEWPPKYIDEKDPEGRMAQTSLVLDMMNRRKTSGPRGHLQGTSRLGTTGILAKSRDTGRHQVQLARSNASISRRADFGARLLSAVHSGWKADPRAVRTDKARLERDRQKRVRLEEMRREYIRKQTEAVYLQQASQPIADGFVPSGDVAEDKQSEEEDEERRPATASQLTHHIRMGVTRRESLGAADVNLWEDLVPQFPDKSDQHHEIGLLPVRPLAHGI